MGHPTIYTFDLMILILFFSYLIHLYINIFWNHKKYYLRNKIFKFLYFSGLLDFFLFYIQNYKFHYELLTCLFMYTLESQDLLV